MNSLAFGWVPEWTLLLVLGFLRAPLYPFNFKQTIYFNGSVKKAASDFSKQKPHGRYILFTVP